MSLIITGFPVTRLVRAEETVNYYDLYTGAKDATSARYAKNLGQRFVVPTGTTLKSVNFVELATWGEVLPVDIQLYAWNTDFATSKAGTVLAEFHRDTQNDNDPINFVFETPFPAGEYLVVFKRDENNSIVTQLLYTNGDTTYFEEGLPVAGRSAYINIGLLNAGVPVTEPNTTEDPLSYVDLFTGDVIEATHFEQNQGQRFVVPVGKFLKSINFVELGTWGDVLPVDMKLYAWNTDFATSAAGPVLATYHKDNHEDNQTVDFVLNNNLPAGQYLVVFKGNVDNQLATAVFAKKGDTTFFVNGVENTDKSAYIKIGLTTAEENTNTGDTSTYFAALFLMIALSAILYKKKAFN